MTLLWTAVVLGFAGSLHCVGMCGPIAVACGRRTHGHGRWAIPLYHAGRIACYACLGAVMGLLGNTVAIFGLGRGLSITTGVIVLTILVLPKALRYRLQSRLGLGHIGRYINAYCRPLINTQRRWTPLAFGFLNGLLPCGLVYLALGAAATSQTMLTGALYMGLFGLGTVPALVAVVLSVARIQTPFSSISIYRLCGVVLAGLLIMRGMALGIPLVSPAITSTENSCCTATSERLEGKLPPAVSRADERLRPSSY